MKDQAKNNNRRYNVWPAPDIHPLIPLSPTARCQFFQFLAVFTDLSRSIKASSYDGLGWSRSRSYRTMTGITQSVITNPIIPGFNPDPTVCRVGDDYFLATSTFEYFPGVPIYHSHDLVNWTVIGHALNRPSQLMMRRTDPGGGIYAPSLRYYRGRFYLSTCCVYSRAGLLVSHILSIARLFHC